MTRYSHKLRLTAMQARVLDVLRAAPDLISVDGIMDALYGVGVARDMTIVRVYVFHINKALERHALRVESVHKRGYRLHDDAKEKLDALLGPLARAEAVTA